MVAGLLEGRVDNIERNIDLVEKDNTRSYEVGVASLERITGSGS